MPGSRWSKRWIVAGLVAAALVGLPVVGWLSLTHQPSFYRASTRMRPAEREAKAKRFVASSLQLRNDISNERDWHAVFTDQEVNAWLAEDLVTYFADQIPPEVHDPRIAFEADRVTLAFGLDRGPIRSVVWVVARPRVSEDNVLSLTLEKIRAGMIPISAESVIGPIIDRAREHGLDVSWAREDGEPVVTIRYKPTTNARRSDIVLERVNIVRGQILLSGRSDRLHGAFIAPTLPNRRLLQLNFPRRTHQRRGGSPESSADHKSIVPTS